MTQVTLLGWAKHDFNRYLIYELLSGGDCFQRLQKSFAAAIMSEKSPTSPSSTTSMQKRPFIEVKSHQLGTLSTGVGLDNCTFLGWLSDLPLGDKKVTLNHLVCVCHVAPLQKLGAGRFERLSVCLDASAGWKLSIEGTRLNKLQLELIDSIHAASSNTLN